MFVHIVFWRIEDTDGAPADAHARELRRRFDTLRGLPGLRRCDVGIDISRTPESADVALYSEFDSRTAYDQYVTHPAHQEIVEYLKTIRTERRVVDYEL